MIEVTMCLNRTASIVKFNARKRKCLPLEYWEISSECRAYMLSVQRRTKREKKDNVGLNIE